MLRLAVCLCLLSPVARAQTVLGGGARAAALGGAQTALVGAASGWANPASWATLPGRAVTFFAAEPFGLDALRLASADGAEPLRWGTVAAGVRVFGSEAYRETHLHAGFARGVRAGSARQIALGLRLRLHHVSIPGYGQASAAASTVGALVELAPGLYAGFEGRNLHRPKLAGRDELPRSLALGLGARLAPRFQVLVDLVKDVRFPLAVRAGVEARAADALTLRAGAASEPARLTAGLGFRVGRLAADIAAERHEALGWSPGIGLGLRW